MVLGIGDKANEADKFWASLKDGAVETVTPIFLEIYMGGVEAALRLAKYAPKPKRGKKADNLSAEAIAAQAQKYIETYTNDWWDALTETTRARLAVVIQRAHDEGTPLEDIIPDVSSLFGESRAELISITETTRLFGAAAQDTYDQLGFEGWDWNTVNDDAVDEICSDNESGSPYPMDQDFEPAHPGCRCWPTPSESSGKAFERADMDAIGDSLADLIVRTVKEVPGTPGPRGLIGPTGRGKQGERGLRGGQGEQGNKGNDGGPGAKGDKGDRGDKGDKGEKGDKGDRGERGPGGRRGGPGPMGERGLTGLVGMQGRDGDQGVKGERGFDGGPGPEGKEGPAGPDAPADGPADVPSLRTLGEGKRQASPGDHFHVNPSPGGGGSGGGGGVSPPNRINVAVEGVDIGQRGSINFKAAGGAVITGVDDPIDDEVDVTITSGGGGGGGSIEVREEDGFPDVASVTQIRVPNNSMVDHGAGSISLVDLTTADGEHAIAGHDLAGTAATNAQSGHVLKSNDTADINDIADTESVGASGKVPDAGHVHAHGSGYLINAHHNKSHNHTAVDGSGLVNHQDLLGVSATQHQHNFLSATHSDTVIGTVVDGDVIIGNATVRWQRLAISIPAANVRNLLGVDNGELRPSWKPLLDATNPAAIGTVGPGTALTAAHRDHIHPTGAGVPTTIAFGDVAAIGTGPAAAMTDHKHGAPSNPTSNHNLLDGAQNQDTLAGAVVEGDLIVGNATPKWARVPISVPAANVRNLLGVDNGETQPSWKAALDATNPTAVAAAAAPGTALIFSHRDHVHAHGSGYLPDAHHNQAHTHNGADGSGTVSHADLTSVTANQHHNQAHNNTDHTTGVAPANVTKAAAAEGVSVAVARADHKHDITTASAGGAVDIGDAAAEGAASSLARSDHVHSVPAPAANYAQDVAVAKADGVATTMARADHVHAAPLYLTILNSIQFHDEVAAALARRIDVMIMGNGATVLDNVPNLRTEIIIPGDYDAIVDASDTNAIGKGNVYSTIEAARAAGRKTVLLRGTSLDTVDITIGAGDSLSRILGENVQTSIVPVNIHSDRADCLFDSLTFLDPTSDSGTANVAVVITGTTLQDTREAWTNNQWIGHKVVVGAASGWVASNNANTLTLVNNGTTGWFDSVMQAVATTPASASAWTLNNVGKGLYLKGQRDVAFACVFTGAVTGGLAFLNGAVTATVVSMPFDGGVFGGLANEGDNRGRAKIESEALAFSSGGNTVSGTLTLAASAITRGQTETLNESHLDNVLVQSMEQANLIIDASDCQAVQCRFIACSNPSLSALLVKATGTKARITSNVFLSCSTWAALAFDANSTNGPLGVQIVSNVVDGNTCYSYLLETRQRDDTASTTIRSMGIAGNLFRTFDGGALRLNAALFNIAGNSFDGVAKNTQTFAINQPASNPGTITTTYTATSMADSTSQGWGKDQWVGHNITAGASVGVISANTVSGVTVVSWSAGTPANGTAYTIDAGVTTTQPTIPYDTIAGTGTLAQKGMGLIGTEEFYWSARDGSFFYGCRRGGNGTTTGTHADNDPGSNLSQRATLNIGGGPADANLFNTVSGNSFDNIQVLAMPYQTSSNGSGSVGNSTCPWNFATNTMSRSGTFNAATSYGIFDNSAQGIIFDCRNNSGINFSGGNFITCSFINRAANVKFNASCVIEVDLGSTPTWFGKFTITDVGGIPSGARVQVVQTTGPYTGKGTKADEADMYTIVCEAEAGINSAVVRWHTEPIMASGVLASGAQYVNRINKVRGKVKFAYTVAPFF